MADIRDLIFRRKHTFIDAPQQLKFSIDLLLHALILPLMVMVCFYVDPFASYLLKTDAEKSRAIVVAFLELCMTNWWIPLFVLMVIGLISVLFSHKIVGPIYHLDDNLKKLMQGEKDVTFNLRQGDYFKEFSNTLTAFLEKKSQDK